MDVENVIVRLVIDDSPLFYSSQANSLIDSIGIKRFTINGEPESPPKFRPLDVDTRLSAQLARLGYALPGLSYWALARRGPA